MNLEGGCGEGQAYNSSPSDHTGYSDNSNSFWHHSDIKNCRYIDILGGDSDSESWRQGENSDEPFLHQNSLGQPRGARTNHIDICITDSIYEMQADRKALEWPHIARLHHLTREWEILTLIHLTEWREILTLHPLTEWRNAQVKTSYRMERNTHIKPSYRMEILTLKQTSYRVERNTHIKPSHRIERNTYITPSYRMERNTHIISSLTDWRNTVLHPLHCYRMEIYCQCSLLQKGDILSAPLTE